MSTENVKIKCPAKPITYAFIYFNDNDERDTYARSANMLKKELRGRNKNITINVRRRKVSPKKLGHVRCCIHTRRGTPLPSISLNRFSKHVSVDGQTVVRTCQSGSLKYHKYQGIESEVEGQMEKWLAKKIVATTVSNREVRLKRREEGKTMSRRVLHRNTKTNGMTKGKVTVGVDKSSNT